MRNNMLFTGKNAQNLNDSLTEISLLDLYVTIAEPDKELIKQIEQLQDIKSLGVDAYRKVKSRLPYYIGAKYLNDYRKPDEFQSIHWFTLDLDHVLNNLGDEEKYKQKLMSDQRIALMFTSPGGEGLKLLFKLSEPLSNTQQYSNFYTAFATTFARHYELESFIDFKTKDASRICFLSVDPKAYLNEDCIAVNTQEYISRFDLLNQPTKGENKVETNGELNDSTYTDILKKLNPKTPKKAKNYIVPDVLRSVMSPIENKARKLEIPVIEKKDISYGQQITFSHKGIITIINLFYGKNGFTVYITNKGDSNEKLGHVCKAIIEDVIYQFDNHPFPIEAQDEIVLLTKAREGISSN